MLDNITKQEIVEVMSTEEARICADAIRHNLGNLRKLVMELYERQGWIALGYSSWRDCVSSEFEFGQSHLYRLLDAARVEQNISPIGETVAIPESHLRPLVPLAPAAQRFVYQAAIDTAPNGKLTAAHIQDTVNAHIPDAKPHVAHNSGENEWYTPSEYIKAARKVMGGIDLDPASSVIANKTVQAIRYFAASDNGLSQEWFGNVWLNPPYSQPLIQQFAEKLVAEWESGRVDQACVLVNNATDTAWLQTMLSVCTALCLVRGRIKFLDPSGRAVGAPLQGQVILYFGTKLDRFADVFKAFGVVVYVH